MEYLFVPLNRTYESELVGYGYGFMLLLYFTFALVFVCAVVNVRFRVTKTKPARALAVRGVCAANKISEDRKRKTSSIETVAASRKSCKNIDFFDGIVRISVRFSVSVYVSVFCVFIIYFLFPFYIQQHWCVFFVLFLRFVSNCAQL